MSRGYEVRPGELVIEAPPPVDAALYFIGTIRTPWTDRADCPRQGRLDGPECRIEVFEPWAPALAGIELYEKIEVLYWLNHSRRDILRQRPRNDATARGAFSLRSPVRPNPIATQLVRLIRVEGPALVVRGLDCLDGTPLVDLKPDSCAYTPLAPRQSGDDRTRR